MTNEMSSSGSGGVKVMEKEEEGEGADAATTRQRVMSILQTAGKKPSAVLVKQAARASTPGTNTKQSSQGPNTGQPRKMVTFELQTPSAGRARRRARHRPAGREKQVGRDGT